MMFRSAITAVRRARLYDRCLAAPAGLVILRYHSVADPDRARAYVNPELSMPPERFREHMRLLHRRAEVISMDDVPAAVARPSRGGRLRVAVTFDDGYRDNHDVALPLLAEEKVVAAFYVTTGPLTSGKGLWISELWRLVRAHDERRRLTTALSSLSETERERALDDLSARAGVLRGDGLAESFMTPDHVRALRSAGMTVGAHTRSHPHLDRLSPEEHDREVAGSKADLEGILGQPVSHLAYPNPGAGGVFGAASRAAAQRAAFTTAVTSTAVPVTATADVLALPRLGVYAGAQEKTLFRRIERALGG